MIRASLAAALALAASPIAASAPKGQEAPRWDRLDDTTRYLRIMGTIDGFSATGPNAPCYPGRDNKTLDESLARHGFGPRDPEDLATVLRPLSDPPGICASVGRRGYGAKLVKTMTDANMAVYVDAMIRGWAAVKPCHEDRLRPAAAAAAAALLSGDDAAQPADLVAGPIAEACAKPSGR